MKNNSITSQRKLQILFNRIDLSEKCEHGKYVINYNLNDNKTIINKYIKSVLCYDTNTIPSNYYFNYKVNAWEECYMTCKSCYGEGNPKFNNCSECQDNYIKKPDVPKTTNCIKKCEYFHYYNIFGKYTCTDNYYCPEGTSIAAPGNKCVDDCNNTEHYKYQYDGECVEQCKTPDQKLNQTNNYCEDDNVNICTLNVRTINGFANLFNSTVINILIKNYIKEFYYTINHVTQIILNDYNILLFRNSSCLIEDKINLHNYYINFADCLEKIYDNKTISYPLIARIDRRGKFNNPTTNYAFFDPNTGDKIPTQYCENIFIDIQKDISYIYNKGDYDWFVNNDIDILDINTPFFSNVCFEYNYNNKDLLLEDRIFLYYPNVTLCEDGCVYNGTNYNTLFTKCQCKYNDDNYNIFGTNKLEDYQVKENQDQIIINAKDRTFFGYSIKLFSCTKYIFSSLFFMKCYGGFIVIGLFLINLACIIKLIYTSFLKNIEICLTIITKLYFKLRSRVIDDKTWHDIDKSKADKIRDVLNFNNNNNNNKTKDRRRKRNKLVRNVRNNMDLFLDDNSKGLFKIKNIDFEKGHNYNHNLIKINEKNIADYLSTRPDEMNYYQAIEKDKRTFLVCLSHKLLKKEIIVNTILGVEETIPLPLKIIILILYINLFFLFFAVKISICLNDIQKLYDVEQEQYLKFFFKGIIFDLLYSFIMASITRNIIDLFLTYKIEIRKIFKKTRENWRIEDDIEAMVKSTKTRFIFFLIFDVSIMIFSWFYISCFNIVFPKSTFHWIYLSLTCFFLDEVIYMFLALLETCIRLFSLCCKIKSLFTISQMINKL